MKLKALVVDDSSLFRRVISDALSQLPEVEVVGTAPNGKIALERVTSLAPDLVTLDIEMPEMSGLDVLEAIKARGVDCGVVMVSALTLKGSEMTIRALERGAFDFITKPSGGDAQSNLASIRDSLAPVVAAYRRRWEIRTILKSPGAVPGRFEPAARSEPAARNEPAARSEPAKTGSLSTPARTEPQARPQPPRTGSLSLPGRADLVLIGISTGGPNALTTMLPMLPARFPAPVLITQHMPPMFTHSLAESLNAKCALRVKEAEDGETALPATVYIAPGGRQMKLAPGSHGEFIVRVNDDPPENNCRPSVDYLFRSAANSFPGRAVAVIMTGMGADGVLGLRLLKRHNTPVIAQDEASCVVFGMPGEAVKAGVVDVIVPLERIAAEISRQVKGAGL
jgi:two-component system, chemotaxis family, protein-glutamate methylesterase/glutaminase